MLASDVWIEKLAILSHEDAIYSVDPLSNYQTSYNDFFEVYITETVTLSPNIQMVLLTSSVQSIYIKQQCHVTNRSLSSLVKLSLADIRYDNS